MEVGEQRMRIVAGVFRGRLLSAPAGETTRPTTDRIREAVFSSIASLAGSDMGGGSVLDAFAGSGALGLEALSRGAASVTFVEQDRDALTAIKRNVDALSAAAITSVVSGDIFGLASRAALPGAPFALLLLDPPYRLEPTKVVELLNVLAKNDLLEDGATVMWEHAKNVSPAWPEEFYLEKHKKYGSTEVDIATYERGAGSS